MKKNTIKKMKKPVIGRSFRETFELGQFDLLTEEGQKEYIDETYKAVGNKRAGLDRNHYMIRLTAARLFLGRRKFELKGRDEKNGAKVNSIAQVKPTEKELSDFAVQLDNKVLTPWLGDGELSRR